MWAATWVVGALAAPERCNGLDDDGDGLSDEAPVLVSLDGDGDGYGSDSSAVLALACPPSLGTSLQDCDDTDANIFPGAFEACNGRDDDCDALVDDDHCACSASMDAGSVWQLCPYDARAWEEAQASCSGMGGHLASLADDATQQAAAARIVPYEMDFWLGGNDLDLEGAWVWTDGAPFGFSAWRQEQPDNGGGAYEAEHCLEMTATSEWNDRTCESTLPFLCERECTALFFRDADGDGLGDPQAAATDCVAPDGHVANALDCDDTDAGQPLVVYADLDEDGWGASESAQIACLTPRRATTGGDCDDGAPAIWPGAPEVPGDGLDSDCDGLDGEPPGESGDTGSPPETETDRAGDDPPSEEGDEKPPTPPPPPYGFGCSTARMDRSGMFGLAGSLGCLLAVRRRAVGRRAVG